MKKELQIQILGLTNTGKSSLLFIIKEYLQEMGLDVKYTPSIDHPTEYDFDEKMRRNRYIRLEMLKNVNISIKEMQVNGGVSV